MNRVVKILMDRDNLTEQEARNQVSSVRNMICDIIAQGDYDEAENIFASELGLEMDYIFDILG